jgi:tRNA A-37 threonylcarbamoyl transferase component Bud32/membrane-associated phospholipid phosphatase
VSRGTAVLLLLLIPVAALWVGLAIDPVLRVVTTADLAVLRVLEGRRSDAATDVSEIVAALGSPWVFRVFAWTILVVLLAVRRFHQLVATLLVLLVVTVVDVAVALRLGRMRPAGIEILGSWDGYSHPSRPVANLALAMTVAVLMLVPSGPWRARAASLSAVVVAALVSARLYLGVDHPTDVAAAIVVGVAVPTVAFRLLTPEEVFPVTYRRGVRAHLDVGGRRGEAIRQGVRRQLGLDVIDVAPFGLSASAGSTPLRLRTATGTFFAKLYASSHLWSDRWYKLARTVRYGRLEDERPFNTVRRLVEYEDHMLRVLAAAGLPTPKPLGIVEITPEREYLIVTEFLEGAVTLAEGDVGDGIIDDALRAVRRLWDAGLAHRDLKPANVLVRDGRVFLVDVAFAEMRPTPWRQAVDLANMMLSLAVRTDPERVYARATRIFSPGEIAEAFAASRSVTIPGQLRNLLRTDDRDLVARFRHLAPERPPVSIQHWSLRRVGLTLAVVAAGAIGFALVVENLRLAGLV